MNKTIAILPGDGIGPEVVHGAVKALQAVEKRFGHIFAYYEGKIGGAALDMEDSPFPDKTKDLVRQSDAVLLGAVGGPKWDTVPVERRPERGLLDLRKFLGVYANLRPVKISPSLIDLSPVKKEIITGTDMLFVRELTSGIYFGEPRGRRENGTVAFETDIYSKKEVERIAHIAFSLAQKRRKKVTSIDKANVLETSKLWREVMIDVGKKYPDVALDHYYVDNAAQQIIKHPTDFDVLVTDNMFGDILSDEGAVLSASLGILPSASIGDTHPYLYEPIHGSAPKYAGHNRANPIGTILSAALLLRHSFELEVEAQAIENAVEKVLADGIRTADIASDGDPVTTSEMGDIIADNIKQD